MISLLDAASGAASAPDTERSAKRSGGVAVPSPPLLRTAEALARVGPRAFGYGFDWRPISDGGAA